MSVKLDEKPPKQSVPATTPAERYLDKQTFRAAKRRVFSKHAPLLAKLAK